MTRITPEQRAAAINAIQAIAEAIKDSTNTPLGGIPAGHLYSMCMGHMNLVTFENIINGLIQADLVRRGPNHLLTWIGA